MSADPELDRLLAALARDEEKHQRPSLTVAAKRTQLAASAPAPRLNTMIAAQGFDPTTQALRAWDARINGCSIIDVATGLNVSTALARTLINEVHAAIAEDLKDNLELNRSLDLARIDGLLACYYPAAKEGDQRAASVVLKALQHRAKLTGQEPEHQPARQTNIESVQAWIVNQLPAINQLVDAMPVE